MITIVGAGLGGLTLARILQSQGKPVTVYEGEPNRKARVQAGILGLDEASGQAALAACKLTEEFARGVVQDSGSVRVLNKAGKVLFLQRTRPADARPEIDRWKLRNMLLDALKPQTVRWGLRLEKIAVQDARFDLAFANGTHAACSTLVGADGPRSKVRAFLTGVKPTYTGITFFEYHIWDAEKVPEAALMGKGSTYALQDDKGLVTQRLSDGTLQVYAVLRGSEASFKGMNPTILSRAFADWAPDLQKLLAFSKNGIKKHPIYTLPMDFAWVNRPNVTLLGDAAHLVSPFSGEGVNLAMLDAADLAAATDWEAYEQAMQARAAAAALGSIHQLETFIAPEGGVALATAMRGGAA